MNFLGYVYLFISVLFTVVFIICMATQQTVTYHPILQNARNFSTNKFSTLGYSKFEKTTYNGNKEFFLNSIEYLTNRENILEARSKQYKIRLLNQVKIDQERSFWQVLNLGLPLVILILFGIGNTYWRKNRYTKNTA